MIYIVLNAVVVFALIYFTRLLDSRIKTNSFEVSSFSVSLLFACGESLLLLATMIFRNYWMDSVTTQFMRIAFCLDGMMFVFLTYGFLSISLNIKKFFPRLIQIALCALVCVLVFSRFSQIDVSNDKGIIIQSEYLFSETARKFFPWTWVTVYTFSFRYILPLVGILIMAIKKEPQATQLEKSQALLSFFALVLMWFCSFIINYISRDIPLFSALYMYAYLFMYMVIYSALKQQTVPTGKVLFITIIRVLISYFLPAAAVGAVAMFAQPLYSNNDGVYFFLLFASIIICVIYAYWISDVFAKSTKFYTADYGASLERDLASIDYATGEMDSIANRMFEILKRNTETSSMCVYILNNQGELETAYTSNNYTTKFPVNTPGFDALLNINRSVVLQTQLEKEHDLADMRNDIQAFFDKTNSDVLFLLNEGHNIFGVITLGRKSNGDHFKDYDYEVFDKLYSHFFVYGYYMRNISNKEVIGIVNREIRMSSQIITSIQENIDHVNNEKIDTGYLMVPSHNIGGEFIDMIRLTATRHLFVVGDLSGKGIAASMNMVILKSIIRTFLAETHDFKELVVKTNTFVRDSLRKGTIFAGLFALIDFETDTMYYINCGIPALMMYTQVYNNVIEIQGSGHVLGFVKDISPYISVKTTKLNHGDIILACTDGLVQSHSLRGEQYGKERIQQDILDNSTYNAQRMAQFTFDDLVKFMSKEMEDDVSILVLKYGSKLKEQEFAKVSEDDEKKEVPEEIVVPDVVEESSEVIEEPSDTISQDYKVDLPDNLDDMPKDEIIAPSADVPDDELPQDFTEEPISVENQDLPDSIQGGVEPLPSEPEAESQRDFSTQQENVQETPKVEQSAEKASTQTASESSSDDMPDLSDLDELLREAGL